MEVFLGPWRGSIESDFWRYGHSAAGPDIALLIVS